MALPEPLVLTQHYLACLSHASYLIGDLRSGRAVVVDPRRDVEIYLDEATEKGLHIERVIETHVHADFLSGHLELAARTGAVISYGAGAQLEFDVEHLTDGQRLSLGEITLQILSTPGHTPESVCVLVFASPEATEPVAVLTGDTLFVGDVGRPDLLASAGSGLTAEVLGRQLYRSLREKLLPLPDATLVYPAHGAGSSCGKALSDETYSTIGAQRRTNYALAPMGEEEFVAAVTEGQPLRPHYFEFDAQRNRELRPLLDAEPLPLLDLADVLDRQANGAQLLDAREPIDYAAGHLRGAVNIGLQGRFAEWAGEVLDPQRDIVLVGGPTVADEARLRLARVGYDRVVGQLADLAATFEDHPELVQTSSRLTIEQLAELRGLEPGLQVVDVRNPGETAAGVLPGAREVPLPALTDLLDGLDRARPLLVYCGSGYRSQVAASVLAERGFDDVSDLLGGYGAWHSAGMPETQLDGPSSASATPEVNARAAQALLAQGAVLLDVRENDEWQEGHAPAALHIPMATVHRRTHELPQGRMVVVVCRSGGRSAAIVDSLLRTGFDAVNLAGGMCAWSAAGLPTQRGKAASDPAGTPPNEAELVVHRADPLNCEIALPSLVGGVVMPNARFYVRNHFPTPMLDAADFRLRIGGAVERPLELTMRELRAMPAQTMVATLECAGNGRAGLDPPVPGEPWRVGAVSTAEWTGVALRDVLDRVGPTAAACEVLFRGADSGVVEGDRLINFERSLTVEQARTSDALLVYAMNGEPLPRQHGYPLRVVVPSWYSVTSVKWLTDIELIGEPFQGFFQVERYVYEWERDGGLEREPVTLQAVRALVTEPEPGAVLAAGPVAIRGVAWSGVAAIERVEVSVGGGAWQPARLVGERRRHSWQWWELLTRVDASGATTIRVRATDLAGRTQPETPAWNRLGYGANAIHAVDVTVG
ncbi:MAG: molybdopterin-dependent oxidoreductase [Sporichthyaceae bacterium]